MNKNKKKVWPLALLITVLILSGCSDSDPGVQEFFVNAEEFLPKITEISTRAGTYVINLDGDVDNFPGIALQTAGVNITVKGIGSSSIAWDSGPGSPNAIFFVETGRLVLENIELSRAVGNTAGGFILNVDGGTVEMKNEVTLSNNSDNNGVRVNGPSSRFIMSGGTIEGCAVGIGINGTGASVTISGGSIRNNAYAGIRFQETSSNCTLSVSGGSITANEDNGIFVLGTGNQIIISGNAVISANNNMGVLFSGESGNYGDHSIKMTGGQIRGHLGTANSRGVMLRGKNSEFIKTGGLIRGTGEDSDNDRNRNGSFGAAQMGTDASLPLLHGRSGDLVSTEVFTVKINATGDGIE